MMNSPAPLPDRSIHDATAQTLADTVQQIAAPFTEAANDPVAEHYRPESEPRVEQEGDDDFLRNPLWMVVAASAFLFAFLAAAVTFG
jgi:hypothetical protein